MLLIGGVCYFVDLAGFVWCDLFLVLNLLCYLGWVWWLGFCG